MDLLQSVMTSNREHKLSLRRTKAKGNQNSPPQHTETLTKMAANDDDNIIKETIKDVLTNDVQLLQPLISSVVTGILQTPEIFNSLVNAVSQAVAAKIADKITPAVKQSVYESVSMDITTTNKEVDKLSKELSKLKNEKLVLEGRVEEGEQYSRRNCLLLHGVPESPDENTTSLAIDTINHHLCDIKTKVKLNLNAKQFDRSHRLGRIKHRDSDNTSPKPRPIIIKFVSYSDRSIVYRAKRGFKRTPLLITENLTQKRMSIYREAQRMAREEEIKSTWTQDGTIFVLTNNSRKIIILSLADLENL